MALKMDNWSYNTWTGWFYEAWRTSWVLKLQNNNKKWSLLFKIFLSTYTVSTTTNIHKNDTIEFVRSTNSYSKIIQENIAFCWSAKLFGAISRRRGKGQTIYLEVWVRLVSINGSEGRDVMVFIGASSTKESTCTIAKVQSREHSTIVQIKTWLSQPLALKYQFMFLDLRFLFSKLFTNT